MGVVAAIVGAKSARDTKKEAKKEAKRQEALAVEAEAEAKLVEDEALRAKAGESSLGSLQSKNVYASLLGGG